MCDDSWFEVWHQHKLGAVSWADAGISNESDRALIMKNLVKQYGRGGWPFLKSCNRVHEIRIQTHTTTSNLKLLTLDPDPKPET
jgi:hypothetical protein